MLAIWTCIYIFLKHWGQKKGLIVHKLWSTIYVHTCDSMQLFHVNLEDVFTRLYCFPLIASLILFIRIALTAICNLPV